MCRGDGQAGGDVGSRARSRRGLGDGQAGGDAGSRARSRRVQRAGERLARSAALLLVLSLPGMVGCPTGAGEGEVVGRIFVLECDGAFNYGSVGQLAYYDMNADFFVGEPIYDEVIQNPEHRLDLRIQRGGNNIEDTDSLYIQIQDVRWVAEQFAAGQGVAVGPDQPVHASLLLYVSCPTFLGSLVATDTPGQAPCPTLDATASEALCEGIDYNESLDPDASFPPFASGQSCIVFCRFGEAARGEPVADDFSVDFGDTVQGLFAFELRDVRQAQSGVELCGDGLDNDGDGQVDEDPCEEARGYGQIRGRFAFEIRRGQVVQEFP